MDRRTPAGPLLTLDEVRQRLAALRAELNRLERDQAVFARAFHTLVAQAVYDTLAQDEERLRALPSLDLTLDDSPVSTPGSTAFDVQPWSGSGPAARCEILDV